MRVRETHPELFTAPDLPEWPQGLPQPLTVPLSARCWDHRGSDTGPGTFVPLSRSQAVLDRLRMLDAYPQRCQARLDALADGLGSVCVTALAGAVDVATTRADAEHGAEVESGFDWGDLIVAGSVAFAVGLVTGGAVIYAAGR